MLVKNLLENMQTGKSFILKDQDLRKKFDKRSRFQKKIDFFLSFFLEAAFRIKFLYKILFKKSAYYHRLNEKQKWKENSQGLVVLLYGLYSHPSVWDKHIELLRSHPEIDFFVPYIPHAGNCSLETATVPIYAHVKDYLQKHKTRPVCLIGFSNGGRLALWLDEKISEEFPGTSVFVSSIAGAHFGSPIVNLLQEAKISWLIMKPVTAKELNYGSESTKEILKKVARNDTKKSSRKYEFWATTEDLTVPDLGSCLPNLGKGERFHVVHRFGHNSIVKSVAEKQISLCTNWLKTLS